MINKKLNSFCIFFITFFSFLAFSTPLPADLYALVIGDTCSADISSQVKKDIKLVKQRANEIAHALSTPAHILLFDGVQANRQSVLTAIEKMPVNSDDVFIFYYSGHGCRTEHKKTKWPILFFSKHAQYMELDEIIAALKNKEARFSLVVADCCNDFHTQPQSGPRSFKLSFNARKQSPLSRYIGHLFGSSQGMVVLSAAKPGEYSWSTDYGGVLTLALLDELSDQKFHPQQRWDSVLNQVVKKTSNVQEPQYAITTQ